MEYINIVPASKEHKEIIVYANKQINENNQTEQTTHLEKVIDEDLYATNPKFKCLIAEIDGKPVGMILYSYFYWANDGEVLWISQMYVEKESRKYGVFFRMIQKLKQENPDIHIASCATGNENKRMQKILNYYGAKEINLKFYYIKK